MSERHRIPVIDRMMDMLGCLERSTEGLTINDLVAACTVPRSTVYRILNTLEAHEIVRRSRQGVYRLGPRLLGLAARVPGGVSRDDLARAAKPHLSWLSGQLGETCKLTVFDEDAALCIAAVEGAQAYSIGASVGDRYPIHAGAASKVLLAAVERDRRAALLAGPLPAFTSRTQTDPAALEAELLRVQRQGWGEDRGEFKLSVRAYAAPVRDRDGQTVAAVSVAYLAEQDSTGLARMRTEVMATAAALSADLGAPAGPTVNAGSAPVALRPSP